MTTSNTDESVATDDQALVVDPVEESDSPLEVTEDGGDSAAPEVEAPPAEAPVAEPPPEPPVQQLPPLPRGMSEAERLHVLQIEQQNAEYSRQAEIARQETEQQSIFNNLVERQGLSDDQAAFVTSEIRAARNQARQAEAAAMQQIQYTQNKTAAAQEYSQTYGIPTKDLMIFESRGAMEAHARLWQASTKNTTDIAQMKKAQIPAQTFDNGQPAAQHLDGEALEQAVGEGTIPLTSEVTARLIAYQKRQGFGG